MDVQKTKRFFFRSAARVATLIMVLGSAFTIFIHYFPSGPTQDSAFFGRWESHYQYRWNGEDIVYRGKIEFVRNGRYNVKGVFEHSGKNSGKPYQYSVQAQGSGNWSVTGGFLTFTLTNLRKDLLDYVVPNEEIPDWILADLKKKLSAELNEKYVPGSSDEYKVVSASKRKLVMQGKDPQGHPFTVINVRQESIL